MICDECLLCLNYHVSEVGCFGSSMTCGSYITDDDDDEDECMDYELMDDSLDCGCCSCCGCTCNEDEIDWDERSYVLED